MHQHREEHLKSSEDPDMRYGGAVLASGVAAAADGARVGGGGERDGVLPVSVPNSG